ncbi:MAG TPA: tRNA lysidine(34) synthetase TilS [Lacipirellulaceae bacterium]|nr:tRNA lysidine(34) synthetase TilS [Lacipirellulaceae bacterium]
MAPPLMRNDCPNLDVVDRLLRNWPGRAWRDVHVGVAVSGGGDSMALLAALLEAKGRVGGAGRVLALHVNHQLRADADADQQWLREQCAQRGIECAVRAVEAPLAARSEEGARLQRYRCLQEMAGQAGARYIAVAHTLEDQAETVLFRLLRGSGLRGMAGMRRTRALDAGVTLVRPLLDVRREELRAYLASQGQTWREDPTNAQPAATRNRLRGQLIPLVRELVNPDADRAIVRAAELAAEAQTLVEAQAADVLASCQSRIADRDIVLEAEQLAELSPLLASEVLRLAWRSAGWPEQRMTRRAWRQLTALAQSAEAASLGLPGGVTARRAADVLSLERPASGV